MTKSKYGLDRNTTCEQFFICEYSKRVYELSTLRNDSLQKCVDFIIEIFKQDNISISRDFASLFLDELIYQAEKSEAWERSPLNYPMVEDLYYKLLPFLFLNGYIDPLLQISLRFRVPYGSLYYPYDMKSVYESYKNEHTLPLQLIMRNDIKKYLIVPTNNQLFFKVPNSMSKNEMINYLIDSVTLYHKLTENNNNDYKELDNIFRHANEKSYRETENNALNKILGLYVYDILLINNIKIDDIVSIYQKCLCNSPFCMSKFRSKEFERCTIKSKCRDHVSKQYKRVNEKINDYFNQYEIDKLTESKCTLMKRYATDYAHKADLDFYKKVSNRGETNLPG